jgi:hypothetical protein
MPIIGQYHNDSIFHLMAHLSPYFSNPSGFGVAEYPLPPGAKISQVQVKIFNVIRISLANPHVDALSAWVTISYPG